MNGKWVIKNELGVSWLFISKGKNNFLVVNEIVDSFCVFWKFLLIVFFYIFKLIYYNKIEFNDEGIMLVLFCFFECFNCVSGR